MDMTEKYLTFLDSVNWYCFVEINEVTPIYIVVDLFQNFSPLFQQLISVFLFFINCFLGIWTINTICLVIYPV